MTPSHANLAALGIGVGLALILAAVGIVGLVKLGRALKRRTEEYKQLPVRAYVDVAQTKISNAVRRIATAPALAYRFKAALRDLASARVKIAAIVTSPSALWRLGELVVTGK